MTIQEKIQQRMGEAADQWYWVAYNMVSQNASYTFALMHIVNRLHHTEGESVQITLPEWKAALRFGKTLIGNASMTLHKIGVIYTNHGRMTWHIEEEKFWEAFEAAFALIFPLMDGDDDDPDGGGTPSGHKQSSGDEQAGDEQAGDKQSSGDEQAGDEQSKGEGGEEGACDTPPIESITITKPEKDTEGGISGFFAALRVRFNGQLQNFTDRMTAAISKIGLAAAQNVVRRCLHYVETRGRSATWAYLATALDNEVIALTSDAPRQLALMPVAEVSRGKKQPPAKPSFDLKSFFDNGVNPPVDAPVLSSGPMTQIVRRPAIESGKYAEVWQVAYEQMRLQDKNRFDQYLQDARLVGFENGVFVVETVSEPVRDTLQNRLYRWVASIVSNALDGMKAKLEFVTAQRMAVAS